MHTTKWQIQMVVSFEADSLAELVIHSGEAFERIRESGGIEAIHHIIQTEHDSNEQVGEAQMLKAEEIFGLHPETYTGRY